MSRMWPCSTSSGEDAGGLAAVGSIYLTGTGTSDAGRPHPTDRGKGKVRSRYCQRLREQGSGKPSFTYPSRILT
jgi:hypothetical protein